MSLVVCKTCNNEISDEAMKCLHCGASTQRKKKFQKRIIISVFSIAIVCVLFFVGSEVYKNHQTNMQQQAEESRQEELYNTVVFYKNYDYETFAELQNLVREKHTLCDHFNSYISTSDELYDNAAVTVSKIAKMDRDGSESMFTTKDDMSYYIISNTTSESKMVIKIDAEALNEDDGRMFALFLCITYNILINKDNYYHYGAISSCSYKDYTYVYFGLSQNA